MENLKTEFRQYLKSSLPELSLPSRKYKQKFSGRDRKLKQKFSGRDRKLKQKIPGRDRKLKQKFSGRDKKFKCDALRNFTKSNTSSWAP